MKKEIIIIAILAAVIVILAAVLMIPKNNAEKAQKSEEPDVQIFSIKAGDIITSPLSIKGEARGTWFFEASFPIKITDEQGNILGSSYARATSDWMTENFVPFTAQINFASENGGKGFLVLQKDNPSGLPENDKEIKIPVILASTEKLKIKLFFNNNKMDPEISCNKVFAVEREIPKIEAIGSAALWELLKGPISEEQEAGFFTSINQGVALKGLKIEKNGTAVADFNEQLQSGVGGSCRVSAIRAQITETLKQFPTIKNVVISIDGRTEDILQP